MIVNGVEIDNNVIIVSATTDGRWYLDVDDGQSGADSKALVWVELETLPKPYCPSERAHFHTSQTDPDRALSFKYVEELFKAAWEIKEHKWTRDQAHNVWFGRML